MMLGQILLLWCFFSNASGLGSEFEALRAKSKIPKDQFGLVVLNERGEELFSYNAEARFIPASISKLATASAVLSALPPGTKIKTQVFGTGDQDGETLKGDLYLKGHGDPSFVAENMWYLVNAFTRTGIRKIRGDLYLDDSLFDDIRFDPSRQDQRVDRAYDAPVGALSFNWNSVNVFVRPGKKGEKAKVFLDPLCDYLNLENRTKTVDGEGHTLRAERISSAGEAGRETIRVEGTLGTSGSEHVIYKNIARPEWWTGHQFRCFLTQRGIQIEGKIRKGQTPKNSVFLAEYEGKPIELVLADMNKFSNNYVAEMLTKALSIHERPGVPGSLEIGNEHIRKHLQSLGLKSFRFVNPSGLSRENLFTSREFGKILWHLKSEFKTYPELMTSLPIGGVDGTLKRRYKNLGFERQVRAKTGLLTGVVSLAGYFSAGPGKEYSFVFMFNGSKNEAEVREFIDQVLVWLSKK